MFPPYKCNYINGLTRLFNYNIFSKICKYLCLPLDFLRNNKTHFQHGKSDASCVASSVHSSPSSSLIHPLTLYPKINPRINPMISKTKSLGLGLIKPAILPATSCTPPAIQSHALSKLISTAPDITIVTNSSIITTVTTTRITVFFFIKMYLLLCNLLNIILYYVKLVNLSPNLSKLHIISISTNQFT